MRSYYVIFVSFILCFKQKTAYERRISDWSSDVCSSDLIVQGNAAPSLDAAHHGIGIHGLYSDNFYLGPQLLHISSDTGNQATTTDRDKNGVDGPRMLAQNLHAHRALPGDYVGIVKGMHEGQFFFLFKFLGMLVGVGKAFAHQPDLTAQAAHRLDLELGIAHV